MTPRDPRAAFDAALIPGMRERLAEGYARFREAEAKVIAKLSPAASDGQPQVYRCRDCPNCGASAPAACILTAHGLDLVGCPVCRMVYSRLVMDERVDADRYQVSDLDLEAMRLRCSGPYLELETARSRFYLDRIRQTRRSASGRLLEIGCGTGTFLHEAAMNAWDVLGIEPGAAAAAVARERGGRVIQGHFPQDLPLDEPPFDVIVLLDVLEHFSDPHKFIALLDRHLAPDGRLFVQVPNWDSFLVQLEGATSSVICPGHWSYFSPSTLQDMLLRAGYRALLIETVVTEIDRIAQFSFAERAVVLARLRPGCSEPENGRGLTVEQIHALQLGYKLTGVFERIEGSGRAGR